MPAVGALTSEALIAAPMSACVPIPKTAAATAPAYAIVLSVWPSVSVGREARPENAGEPDEHDAAGCEEPAADDHEVLVVLQPGETWGSRRLVGELVGQSLADDEPGDPECDRQRAGDECGEPFEAREHFAVPFVVRLS